MPSAFVSNVLCAVALYVSHKNDVYVCMTAGSYDGCVYSISLHTAEIKWNFQTGGLVKSSPALCLNGSAVVVGSYDQILYCISILVCLVTLKKSCRLVTSGWNSVCVCVWGSMHIRERVVLNLSVWILSYSERVTSPYNFLLILLNALLCK